MTYRPVLMEIDEQEARAIVELATAVFGEWNSIPMDAEPLLLRIWERFPTVAEEFNYFSRLRT